MSTENIGRVMPQHLEAEMSILGAMLRDPSCISTVIEQVDPDDFYQMSHREIYEAIRAVYERTDRVEPIVVEEELRRRKTSDKIGGLVYLVDLSAGNFIIANIQNYIDLVRDKAILRRLIKASDSIMGWAYDDELETSMIVEKSEQSIFEISGYNKKTGLVPISAVMAETFRGVEERAANGGGLTGVPTGFVDLDYILHGLQKSDLILVAARPAMGKTAFMVNIATHAAVRAEKKVAMFSLEMSREQLGMRIISSLSHVNLEHIISGRLEESEWQALLNAASVSKGDFLSIDDTAGTSVLEIKAKCRRMMQEKGLDLIVIDYLQLMAGDRRNENRQQEISAISRGLKIMAKELNVPVVALSQLSRAPEARTDKRPMLSDLRESGAIEQDADIVMFLYRDDYYNKDSDKKGIGEVIIAKHRNGATGTVELTFLPEYTKFVNNERQS